MASSVKKVEANISSEKTLLRERGFELGYRPVLDGLRCVAIMLVLFFHGARGKMPGGWVGVEIFFVLSGFLITTLLLLEIQKRGRIDLRKFYIRRALRLFPALYSMLFLAYLTSFFLVENRDTFLGEIMAAGLHVWNYGPELGFWEFGAPTRISHTWSLSTEEQFYLVWPFFLSLLVALRSKAWLSVGVLTALYLALPGYQVIILGCILAIVFPSKMPEKMATPVAALATLSALFLIYVAFLGPEKTFLVKLLCGSTSCVLIYYLIFSPKSWAARLLAHRIPIYVGRISYGLYLWHVPVNKLLYHLWGKVPAAYHIPVFFIKIAVAFLVAGLSYRFIEEPFLKKKAKFSSRESGENQ